MRARLPLLVLVVCSVTFIASLYLPWGSQGTSLTSLFTSEQSLDGWSVDGQIPALTALALAASAALRPAVAVRLPLGRCALALAYFAVATFLQVRTVERQVQLSTPHNPSHYHLAYGGYLGLASAGVALVMVAALRRDEIVRRLSGSEAAVAALSLAVLVAYLLPWERARGLSYPGIITAPVTLAALVLCAGPWLFGPRVRAATAGVVALLTGASISLSAGLRISYAYGAWVALGFAVTLFAVTAVFARDAARPTRPGLLAACTGAAAIILTASLFMPWAAGRPRLDGWWATGAFGSVTGLLAVLLVLALVFPRLERHVVEASVAVAVFVLTLGLALSGFGFTLALHIDFVYGAYVGFAAAGLILVLGVARLRLRPLDRTRLPVASIAIVVSLLYLAMVVVPLWHVLPHRLQGEAPPLNEWISAASILLSLHLLVSWIREAAGSTTVSRTLVLIPLGLLALVTLGAVGDRLLEPNGGLAVVLGLGVVLAWLGWIEPRGFAGLRVPEAFRVDRLPEPES